MVVVDGSRSVEHDADKSAEGSFPLELMGVDDIDSGVRAIAQVILGRSLHIDGDAAALHVVVQQTTIADVLSALAGFNVRYRSSIGLDEMRDGSYVGSLGHVVARLLNGYDYATKQDGSGSK